MYRIARSLVKSKERMNLFELLIQYYSPVIDIVGSGKTEISEVKRWGMKY